MSRLCEFYPGICFATEEKAQKSLSQVKKNLSQNIVYILPKHPHIRKPTQTHTQKHTPTHIHTHVHTYTHIHTHIHTHTTHTHTPHTHTYTHIYTHTHTPLTHIHRTHIHTYIHTL